MPLPPGGYLSNSSSDLDIVKEFLRQNPSAGRTLLERHTGWSQHKTNKMLKAARAARGTVTKPQEKVISVDDLQQRLVAALQESPRTQIELCESLDCRPSEVRELLVSVEGVKREGDKFWIEKVAPEMPEALRADREARRAKEEAKSTKEKYDALLEQHEKLEQQLEFALHLKASFSPARITKNESLSTGQATAIALASDWHVGQRVDASTVSGLNEFNPDIAERRAKNFFRNLLSLVRKERQEVAIETLVLWLGGDFLSNVIHPELLETNYLSPFQEAELAQNLLAGGLKLLQDDGEFEKIVVVCNSGNHGRATQKIHHASETLNSHEHAIFWNLRRNFPALDWQIATGYFHYIQIYDQLHRFHHGHNTKYGGGIGGITIPLIKFVHRANQQRNAAHDWLGHYHQLTRHQDFTINGSLVGFDAYALSIGARPERPQQAFQLIDAKRGFTIAAPILLEDV